MKPRQLPQPTLARWLDLGERCEALALVALAAESEVARLRAVLSSRTNDVTPDEFAQARDSFEAIHLDMQRKRAKADVQARLLATTKRWIESLPANIKVTLVHPPTNGVRLEDIRAELKELREQLRQLQSFPPASSDIEARVRNYVSALARSATPLVRGYQSGGALDVRWPLSPTSDRRSGSGFAHDHANPLLLWAALDPAGLSGLILRAVMAEQPLSAVEHAARVAELEAKIDVATYALGALTEKAGIEFDPELSPRHVLGVRIGEASEGEAAA